MQSSSRPQGRRGNIYQSPTIWHMQSLVMTPAINKTSVTIVVSNVIWLQNAQSQTKHRNPMTRLSNQLEVIPLIVLEPWQVT